jgi:CubicO group peptidase (beta-lactamase class C family)
MRLSAPFLILLAAGSISAAQDELPRALRSRIDRAVTDALAKSGAPSASIAVVRNGALAYVQAYGTANLEAKRPATPQMRYSIGSVSKQFTATAILLLQEEGKLSLDDHVSRFLPELTRSDEVTLRQILSMTSGYQDYWPQDYVMPGMLKPTTAQGILDGWARIPLDFEPGAKWQYSNTNYVIAGLVVEKVAGAPLVQFLTDRVFRPLGMSSVTNTDEAPLGPEDPARYMRFGLGPLRPAPKEGKGWVFAAGELAMTASDLARWDVSMIEQRVLKPASYRALESEVLLNSGAGTQYGLGVGVRLSDGRRVIAHTGEVSGFTASNRVFPDDHAAIIVLANLDGTSATALASQEIADLLFAPAAGGPLDEAKRVFAGLQEGRIDRALLTANANAYFTGQALSDLSASLARLGAPKDFQLDSESHRGGMTFRGYKVRFAKATLHITTFATPDGKLEQFMVAEE